MNLMHKKSMDRLETCQQWANALDLDHERPTISMPEGGRINNIKLVSIPSISLPPVLTCAAHATCKESCYAMKMVRKWSGLSVAKSWTRNWAIYQHNPRRYWNTIRGFLMSAEPSFFRYHVGGDIPDAAYFGQMKSVAREFKDVKFMTFTKKEFDFTRLPKNLRVIYSVWPGMDIPVVAKNLPKAYVNFDVRRPSNTMACSGVCDGCEKCWSLKPKQSVCFKKH